MNAHPSASAVPVATSQPAIAAPLDSPRCAGLRAWFESAAVLLAVLALWWLASHLEWVSKVFLPTPEATLASLLQGLNLRHASDASPGELAGFAASTVQRMLFGWLLASFAGIALGAVRHFERGAHLAQADA